MILALPSFIEFNPSLIDFVSPVLLYLGPISSVLGILGILALYPSLFDSAPRLSRISIIVLVIAVVCRITGFAGSQLVKLYQFEVIVPLLSFLLYATFTTLFVGFLLLGVAIFSTDQYPNLIGYLLLVPALLAAVGFASFLLQIYGYMIGWIFTMSLCIQALDYLALGYIIKEQHGIEYSKVAILWSRLKEVV